MNRPRLPESLLGNRHLWTYTHRRRVAPYFKGPAGRIERKPLPVHGVAVDLHIADKAYVLATTDVTVRVDILVAVRSDT